MVWIKQSYWWVALTLFIFLEGLDSGGPQEDSNEEALPALNDKQEGKWRNVEGLAKKSPLRGKKSPLRGAPRSRVYLEQFLKKIAEKSK